jgi:hypothetical protein
VPRKKPQEAQEQNSSLFSKFSDMPAEGGPSRIILVVDLERLAISTRSAICGQIDAVPSSRTKPSVELLPVCTTSF